MNNQNGFPRPFPNDSGITALPKRFFLFCGGGMIFPAADQLLTHRIHEGLQVINHKSIIYKNFKNNFKKGLTLKLLDGSQ